MSLIPTYIRDCEFIHKSTKPQSLQRFPHLMIRAEMAAITL